MKKRGIAFIFIMVLFCLEINAGNKKVDSESKVDIPSQTELQILSQLGELNNSIETLRSQVSESKSQQDEEKTEDVSMTDMLLGISCFLGIVNLVLLVLLLRKNVVSMQRQESVVTDIMPTTKETEDKTDSILISVQRLTEAISRIENDLLQRLQQIPSYESPYQQYPPQLQKEKKTEPVRKNQEEKHRQPNRQTLYVQPDMEGGTIKLVDGGEDYKDMMPFVVQATGNEGNVRFNSANLGSALENLETAIMPFSNCSIVTTGTAHQIETVKEGRAQKRGNQWELTEKPTIRVV